MALSLELALLRDLNGSFLRYAIGWQSILFQNYAHSELFSGNNSADAKDRRELTSDVQGGRFVTHVGVEW